MAKWDANSKDFLARANWLMEEAGTMDGKRDAFAGGQSIDNIDGSLKLFERRS